MKKYLVGLMCALAPIVYGNNLESKIKYMKNPPKSISSFPHAPRPMSKEEGNKFYYQGMLPLVKSANYPTPYSSEFNDAINDGRIVNPPCATCQSQVMEYAAKKSRLEWIAKLFSNPKGYYVTHNNEYQMKLLGFNYYSSNDYVAPTGSIGMWSRYKFHGVKDHSGHIFIVFKDNGGKKPLIGDNTRRKGELHGHPYRQNGRMVGFWLPPGVNPEKRSYEVVYK